MALGDTSLTAEDVATLLKVNKNTVYAMAKSGELASYRIGRKMRFSLDDVQAYVSQAKTSNRGVPSASTHAARSKPHDQSLAPTGNPRSRAARSKEFILGGGDMMLDIMANYLSVAGIATKRNYASSYQNLVDMYFGTIDAAAISLWDSSSDRYNIPFIKHLLPGIPVKVFKMAEYTQGFLVRKGDHQRFRSWGDLLQPGIRLANREKGSAPRILLDEKLRMLEADPYTIDGYPYEITSPVVQATLVAKGEADVGVGTEKLFHRVPGIDYLPMQTEQLVLVVAKRRENEEGIRAASAYLSSKLFRDELDSMDGYRFDGLGECVYET